MFWADRVAQEIVASGKYTPYRVDDMKTPSGRVHVGSLRGVVMHDLIYKALLHAGKNVQFTYVFDDHDPMDALPVYLSEATWSKYLGCPLFTIPSPDGKAPNYAQYFANEFTRVFRAIECHPTILWSSELYTTGKMNNGIRECLDKVHVIRRIYEELYKKEPGSDWYPFQVVCPKCGKLSTTKVYAWDGEQVSFTCNVDAVEWTRGCGFSGKVSPLSGQGTFIGKLSWKVEWPVKWQVIGVTIEGAGKDHMTAGGSYDVARLICERVLEYPTPYAIAYEHFLIGGKKMSSSKGLGSSAKEISQITPPYLLRFLFSRTDHRQAIEFDPVGTMAIPDLFDEYDRCWQAYVAQTNDDLGRAFELSQVGALPGKTPMFLPRFRDVANYMQLPNVDLSKKFEHIKGEALTSQELSILEERKKYARIWTDRYAPGKYRLKMSATLPSEVTKLTPAQRAYLGQVASLMQKEMSAQDLQVSLYDKAKGVGLESEGAFAAIYTAMIGKKHGPKAAWFLLQYPREQVMKRLLEAAS